MFSFTRARCRSWPHPTPGQVKAFLLVHLTDHDALRRIRSASRTRWRKLISPVPSRLGCLVCNPHDDDIARGIRDALREHAGEDFGDND